MQSADQCQSDKSGENINAKKLRIQTGDITKESLGDISCYAFVE